MLETKNIRCVNEDCGYIEPAKGDEQSYKFDYGFSKGSRAVRNGGYSVLCSKCGCQTELI